MAVTKLSNSGIRTGGNLKYDTMLAGNPGVPPAPTATAAVNGATITFSAIAGATSYQVLSSAGQTATGTSSPISVTGLTGGQSYTFQLRYTTAAGTSGYSQPSNSITALSAVGRIAVLQPANTDRQLFAHDIVSLSNDLYLIGYFYSGATGTQDGYMGRISNSTFANVAHNTYVNSRHPSGGTYNGAVIDASGNIATTINGSSRSSQISLSPTTYAQVQSASTNNNNFNLLFGLDYYPAGNVIFCGGWVFGTGYSMLTSRLQSPFSGVNGIALNDGDIFNYFHNVAAQQNGVGVFGVGDIQYNPRRATVHYATGTNMATSWSQGMTGAVNTGAFFENAVHNTTNDTVITVGYHENNGLIAIWNRSNGSLITQNGLNECQFYGLGWDSSENMFYVAASNGVIAKFNSSGVLQWQRRLSANNGQQVGFSQRQHIQFVGNDFIVVGAHNIGSSTLAPVVLRMPKSGAGSGGSLVLNGITYTYSTSTFTSGSLGLNVNNNNWTRQTIALSDDTSTATVTPLTVTSLNGAI